MPSQKVVIDLTLDSDDEDPQPIPAGNRMQLEELPEDHHDAAPDLDFWDGFHPMPGQYDEQQLPNGGDFHPMPGQYDEQQITSQGDFDDVPLVIDDFGYLDEEPQQQPGAQQEGRDAELARELDNEEQTMTKDDYLARICDMFPDMCPEHAQSVYDQVGTDAEYELLPAERLDRITEKIIADGPYPKLQKNNQHLKRKREESTEGRATTEKACLAFFPGLFARYSRRSSQRSRRLILTRSSLSRDICSNHTSVLPSSEIPTTTHVAGGHPRLAQTRIPSSRARAGLHSEKNSPLHASEHRQTASFVTRRRPRSVQRTTTYDARLPKVAQPNVKRASTTCL
jgi:hypothetical protein